MTSETGGSPAPDPDPWGDSKERVKQLKAAALQVVDYMGGVDRKKKGPHKLKVGLQLVMRSPLPRPRAAQ